MKNFITANYGTIIVIIVLLIIGFYALRYMFSNKDKCAYCRHSDSCPIKKIKKY